MPSVPSILPWLGLSVLSACAGDSSPRAPLATIARGPFALRVFTAPSDGNREIFCGDIGA